MPTRPQRPVLRAQAAEMSRYFRPSEIHVNFARTSWWSRAGSCGHKPPSRALASLSGPHRSQASDLHRRDVDQDQHDPASRLGAEGERLVDKVPQGKWKTATFLAALRNDRIDAPCLFDGPINGERFRAYVEQFLVPTLKPGDAVILDNLGSHKGKGVRKAIRAVGARLVFLPEILPRPQPDRAGLRQVQDFAAKGRSAKLRGDLRRKR